MSTPKWEVVTKTQRKSKIPQHVSQKNKKKVDPNSMPRIEPAAPVKESPTIYDAFMEKQTNHTQPSGVPVKSPPGTDRTQSPKKNAGTKRKTGDKKPGKVSLEDVIDEISYDDVESFIEKEQTTFPDNPPLWVMDLASMINFKLKEVADTDPVLQGSPKEYPLSLLPTEVRNLVGDTMLQCSKVKISQCFTQIVNDLANDLGKGESVHGYRISIQLACQLDPSVIMDHFPQFQDMIKTNQNRHLRGLAIMWAVGQVGYQDLTKGLKVWFELMLPFLNVRSMASYIVEYLEALFDCPDNHSAEATVSEKHFFQLFDLMHNLQQLSLPGPLQKKLQTVYPKVKALALKPGTEGMSRVIFPSFLKRCNEGIKDSLRNEIVDCLVLCLQQDKSTFSHWRQVYTKYLPPSGVLLHYLNDNWTTVGSKLDKKLLKETITAFILTNEDLLKKDKNNIDCDQACKELNAHLATRRVSWLWLPLVLFIVALGVVAYDIYLHESFQKSRTRAYLHDLGILMYLQQAWTHSAYYIGIAVEWLSENVPYYYGKICDVAAPYLSLFWEKLFAFGVFIMEVTAPVRLWLSEKVPLVLEWIDSKLPWLWGSVCHYVSVVWAVLVRWGSTVWSFISHYTLHAGVWLQENVFSGSLSVEHIQESVVSGVHSLWVVIQYSALKVGSLIKNTTAELLW